MIKFHKTSKYTIYHKSKEFGLDYQECITVRIRYLKSLLILIKNELDYRLKLGIKGTQVDRFFLELDNTKLANTMAEIRLELLDLDNTETTKIPKKSQWDVVNNMSVEDVLSTISYKQSGDEYYLKTPWRDSSGQSLYINSETGLWHDKVTGEKGNKWQLWKMLN